MTGKIMPLRERDTSTIQAAADAFLVLAAVRQPDANPNTRRGYTGVLDRLLAGLGASRPLAEVSGEELAGLLEQLWGQRAPATWNRNRGAVAAWLSWCAASRLPAPVLPASAERRREHLNATRAVPRPAIDRALTRRDVPLREKTLWRMLYETAARASEVLALNIEDLDLDARRAPIRSKGGDTEWICWGSGTAHLLPRLIKIVYLLVRRILGLAVLVFRGDRAKDAELLVLRHENAVLRRHAGRVRSRRPTGCGSPR